MVAQCTSRFDYLIGRIERAEFSSEPFKLLCLEDFFRPDDFREIIRSPEINLPPVSSDSDLFGALFGAGYKIVHFPGCLSDRQAYLAWRESPSRHAAMSSACETIGITVRLFQAQTPIIRELNAFFAGEAFNRALAGKFGVSFESCVLDNGIQKYLDGYEISPHPDVRRKALTFMVNINPHTGSAECNHHTHYLRFRREREFVRDYWERNERTERCWVPWNWCETVRVQRENNSFVAFSPSADTLHGVRARYDHLTAQRTQIYGNLWYKASPRLVTREWEEFDGRAPARPGIPLRTRGRKLIGGMIPDRIKRRLRRALRGAETGSQDEIGPRDF